MSEQNFKDMAREWLVRAQGHARPEHETSLAVELGRAHTLGRIDATQFAKNLTMWVAQNAQRESVLLYPNPAHYVFFEPLLDFIVAELGVSKETVGAWVDEAHDPAAKPPG